MPASQSLYIKNATVALLVVVPILLIALPGEEGPAPDQPPIITLAEAEGYTFNTGSAKLSSDFIAALDSRIAPRLRHIAETYECDIIEVIGHTDGQVVRTVSTLDSTLLSATYDQAVPIVPGSNADLGLMRAWTVANRLQQNTALRHLTFHPYSAGQVIDTTGRYAAANDFQNRPERRRIEIRARRSSNRSSPVRRGG